MNYLNSKQIAFFLT